MKTRKRHENVRLHNDCVLRTDSWSNDSHLIGVFKPVYGIPNSNYRQICVMDKTHIYKIVKY